MPVRLKSHLRAGAANSGRRANSPDRSCCLGSGGIEADLEPAFSQAEQVSSGNDEITPGFEQAKCQILGGTPPIGESILKQATLFDQLKDDASQLQEQVEHLASGGVFTIGMFQVEIAVLLDIEAFVLDLPTQAGTLVGKAVDVAGSEGEIGQPLVMDSVDLSPRIRLAFETFEQIEGMLAVLGIGVGQVFSPGIVLHGLFLPAQGDLFVVLG